MLFDYDAEVPFHGAAYTEADKQRCLFEARCWEAGIVPVRGPSLGASILNGIVRLENGYRFADLSGAQTETALLTGHSVATNFRALNALNLL